MSTRIHKKIPLAAPLIAVAESITRVPAEGQITIMSRNGMLLHFLAGEAMLSLNGAAPVLVREGSVVIATRPSTRVYSSTGNTAAPLHFYGISFSRTRSSSTSRALPPHQREMQSLINKAFAKSAVLVDATNQAMRQRLLALRHAFDDRHPGGAVLLYTAVLDLCVETARLVLNHQSWRDAGPGRRKSRSLVNTALEYMLRNLKSDPNIENVAWSVQVTSEHLCRVFRKELGITPREALRNMQIDAAKSLLINSPIEVHRVAEQSGFASATAFGRYFKNAVGSTPTQYRADNVGNFTTTRLR